MIQKNFKDIKKADIESLIENGDCELKTLEYKEKLPGNADKAKREFFADVSSFANASGGDLLYGIEEKRDENGKKTGQPECVRPLKGESADEAKLRISQMTLNGIKPRFRFEIQEIAGWGDDGSNFVILLRVPKSFASPHMVTFKGSSRFFSRTSSGKYPLDVDEIGGAFLATESQADRLRGFHLDRLGKIVADETPVVLSSPRRLVLHIIPVASFLNNERLDIDDMSNQGNHLTPIGLTGREQRFNLEGFLTLGRDQQRDNQYHSYCQLFFDASIEVVWSGTETLGG